MKKIFLLFLLFVNFSYAELDISTSCCYEGETSTCSHPNSDYYKLGSYEDMTDSQLYNYMQQQYPEQCVQHGLVGQHTYDQESRHVVDTRGGEYYYSGDWGYTTRDTCCSCNLPDIVTDVNLSQWQLFDTADNEDSLNQVCFNNSDYLIETTRIDCSSISKCYLKIKYYYNCSSLGDNWSRAEASSSNDCNEYVIDSDYNNDSVQWHTGTDILDTCCVHSIFDNNGTGGNDNNDTGGIGGNDNNDTGGTGGNDTDSQLSNINDNITNSATQAHEDSSNLQASIDNFSNRNHDDLLTLADILRGDGSGDGKIDEVLNAYSNILNNAYETIPQKFNNLASFTFGAVPAFSSSSGDCTFTADLSYGNYTINLNEYTALISPYTSVLFSLLFIFISIKWWYKSFLIILKVL